MSAAMRWDIQSQHDPLVEHAGLYALLAPQGEALDARAFCVLCSLDAARAMMVEDHLHAAPGTEWTAYFVESMVEFLVWTHGAAGQLDAQDLGWLMQEIGEAPSPSTPALLFALVRELNEVPECLTALAMRFHRNRHASLH